MAQPRLSDTDFLKWPFFERQHSELRDAVSSWCDSFEPGESKDDYRIAANCVKSLGQAGLLRYCVPAADGGALEKLDVRSLCLVRETLAYSNGLFDFAFAMQGLGAGPISLFGNSEQRKSYLPQVSQGDKIAAFALSEELAGSDVAALATSARLEGDSYILNGEKTWISNAGLADFYV
ncbi:MAG: acyl-CoA dehydrogenase family protein, partial [Bdellovibrionales bacterium]|nr:acyl-CoA dehydrogenase family protein [Bdellovibrionales bacterium]